MKMLSVTSETVSRLLLLFTLNVWSTKGCGQERSKDVYFIKDQDFSNRELSAGQTLQSILRGFSITTREKGEKIVGGSDVNDPSGGRLCWQVVMELTGMLGQVRCGGSIIGSRTILTAAHCVSGNRGSGGGVLWPANTIAIMTGALDDSFVGTNPSHGATNCGRRFNVAKVVRHPDYNRRSMNNDLALIILTEDINLDATCTCAVCLARQSPSAGEWCINSGYGQESDSGIEERNPTPLKYIYQQILRNFQDPKCQYDFDTDGNNFVCAGGVAGIDNCYGDSGGPLVCNNRNLGVYYQTGIVSYGPGQCGDGQGTRYTSVSKYLDWIIANSNGNVSPV